MDFILTIVLCRARRSSEERYGQKALNRLAGEDASKFLSVNYVCSYVRVLMHWNICLV